MKLSITKERALLDNICGKSEYFTIGSKDACYLGVYAQCQSTDAGAVKFADNLYGKEVSGNNYSRARIDDIMSRTYRSHAKGESSATQHDDRIGNTEDINFNAAYDPSNPTASSGADWGTIVGFGLFGSRSGGDPYAYGKVEDNNGVYPTVYTHNTLHFIKGYFEIYLDEATAAASVS